MVLLSFNSTAACKGGSTRTFGHVSATAFQSEGEDLMVKSKRAGDAPQLCPDGRPCHSMLQPAPALKGQERAMCKLLHSPAVTLTQILQDQGQTQQKELISATQRQELEATCLKE